MSLKEKINSNQAIAYGVVAVIMIVAMLLAYKALFGGDASLSHKWMWDMNANHLVKASSKRISPYESGSGLYDYPSGPAGALLDALVFSCGDPLAIRDGMTLEELEAIDARVVYVSRKIPLSPEESGGRGGFRTVVSGLGEEVWAPRESGYTVRLREEALACEDGSYAVYAIP